MRLGMMVGYASGKIEIAAGIDQTGRRTGCIRCLGPQKHTALML